MAEPVLVPVNPEGIPGAAVGTAVRDGDDPRAVELEVAAALLRREIEDDGARAAGLGA